MDKLKQYGAALRKHYFWVLSSIVLVVGLSTWASGTSALQARFNENQSQLKTTISGLDDIDRRTGPGAGDDRAPNAKFTEGLNKEQQTLRSQVFDAWGDVYEKQKLITEWPKDVADIAKLGPHERIPDDLRQTYMTTALPKEWQEMFTKVQVRHPKGNMQVNLDDFNARRQTVEYEGIVVWDQEQRDELMKRYQVSDIPSDLRVRVTQEDMWVFRSMIEMIAALNHGANDSLAATVKRIDKLDLAQWAIADAQKNPGAKLDLKKEGEAEMAAPSQMGNEESIVPIPGTADHTEDKWLLEGRYLDQKNQPISEADAKNNPPFREFKQLFVNMQFVMDQRKIPDLLAACANSPLRIEPRQVIMQFTDVDHKSTNVEGEELNMGPKFERGPFDCVLQIRGIAYIYNEPEQAKLGAGSAPQPAQRELGIPVPKKEAPVVPTQEEAPLF